MDILRATIHLLHGQTDNSLTRIDRLFLNSDPRKGVACLIELLAEVLDAELNLFGKKVRPVKDWLVRYLKSGFALRYERRKQIASAETTETRTVQPFVLTPTLVSGLLRCQWKIAFSHFLCILSLCVCKMLFVNNRQELIYNTV